MRTELLTYMDLRVAPQQLEDKIEISPRGSKQIYLIINKINNHFVYIIIICPKFTLF